MTPTDDLTEECITYLRSLGSTSKQVSDIVDNKDSIAYKAIDEGLPAVNLIKISLHG